MELPFYTNGYEHALTQYRQLQPKLTIMKNKILSILIASIFILSSETVEAQNPKISNPDKATVDLSCSYDDGSYTVAIKYLRLTGLGNATSVTAQLTVTATADVSCYNSGQLKQGEPVKSMPGQSSTASGNEVTLTPKNGVLILQNCVVSTSIVGDCKNSNTNNGFESAVTNVDVSDLYITINGSQVSLRNYISQLDACEGICN